MRKAFEKNVARRRPQLRRAAAVEELDPDAPGAAPTVAPVSQAAATPAPAEGVGDATGRLERLARIKHRVAELAASAPRVELEKIRRRIVRAAQPVAPLPPVPVVPAGETGDVLSRVEALGAELARTHDRKEALRGELARAAGEARGATGRLAAAYADYLLQVALRQRAQANQPESGCALAAGT